MDPVETISISKFKATCLEVLQQVQLTGKTVVVTKRGMPVAQVTPAAAGATASWAGSLASRGKILGDVVSPVGEADWEVLT